MIKISQQSQNEHQLSLLNKFNQYLYTLINDVHNSRIDECLDLVDLLYSYGMTPQEVELYLISHIDQLHNIKTRARKDGLYSQT